MARSYSDLELESYLDEALPAREMAALEAALRSETQLSQRLAAIIARRDAGVHSLSEIWRRHRISCPTREQLGSFLLGVLDADHDAYIRFHLDVAGCRYCAANLDDLKQRQEQQPETEGRRKRYFESSAGYLRRDR